jgi:hypothetical protein
MGIDAIKPLTKEHNGAIATNVLSSFWIVSVIYKERNT